MREWKLRDCQKRNVENTGLESLGPKCRVENVNLENAGPTGDLAFPENVMCV